MARTSPDDAGLAPPAHDADEPSRLADERLYAAVRRACEAHDPVPAGLVDRCVFVARPEQSLPDDLDYELLVLLEQCSELVGARGGTASSYTMRLGNETVELLLRASPADDEGRARLDGWVVPPGPGSVEARRVGGDERSYEVAVDGGGRFELVDLPRGLYRLWLQGAGSATLGTPAFEI